MKIILQKSVDRLGDPGDVADVADGYARNYLIPRGLAVKAEKGTVRHAESLKRAHEVRTSAQKGDFEALAARIIQAPVVVTARAGEEGKLFGSVTAADIAEALSAQVNVPIGRRDVHLDEPIRSVGTHEVTVHLHPEVDPVITVDVQPLEAQPREGQPREVQSKDVQPPDVQPQQ
jgi:large subunit ribosomal protein L9